MIKRLDGDYLITETANAVLTKKISLNKIKLDKASTNLNTIINIPINYQLFDLATLDYVIDTSINKTVDIYVNDALTTTEDIMDGIGNIEFESAEPGTFKVKVENVECEVIVNG